MADSADNRAVLGGGAVNGLVCLYRKDGKVIGHNLCFLYNGNLIDKYVGFCYPQAREFNLYFISWLENLQHAANKRLKYYIAGCATPELKSYLGASFTLTYHAVHIRNRLLRELLGKARHCFEPDSKVLKNRASR